MTAHTEKGANLLSDLTDIVESEGVEEEQSAVGPCRGDGEGIYMSECMIDRAKLSNHQGVPGRMLMG